MGLTLIALPLTGLAVTSVARSAGSVGCSLVLDQLACAGTAKRKLSNRRIVGALMLLSGTALAVWQELLLDVSGTAALASGLPFIGGVLLPLQAAINAQLARSLGAPLRAALVSFVGGSLCLGVGVVACGTPHGVALELEPGALCTLSAANNWSLLRPSGADVALADAPWWAFTGGVFGLLFVTANLTLPRTLGFGSVAAFTTFGTLACSLILDAAGWFGLLPRPISPLRWGGTVLTLVGAVAVRAAPVKAVPLLRNDAAVRSPAMDACDGVTPASAFSGCDLSSLTALELSMKSGTAQCGGCEEGATDSRPQALIK